MATVLLQVAGGLVGGLLGPIGAAVGTAAGALAGYAVDRTLIDGTRRVEGPRLTGPRPFSAEDGAPLARVYGTARVGGALIWATRFEETRQTTRQGSKGGPKVTEYRYFANLAFALAEGEIASVRRVWADGRELDRNKVEMRFHKGSASQAVDPLISAKQGAGNAPAYRGTAYAVFERFPIEEYGNRIPQFQFEVLRPAGRLASGMRGVALIPGATEFGLSPGRVTREIREGRTESLNRHFLFAGSDLLASLDELVALCSALEHVALVVTWFGDDLRAGECRIRPAATDHATSGYSKPWRVSGLTRATAPTVSSHGGGAAYGGSPSDRSVMDAIAEIKRRGLKVTLYPFVMMDVPPGNGLPDPHGGTGQPAYPWRGRITCSPAPGAPGSADKTAAARTQVEAFCGSAVPSDFSPAGDTIAFGGSPSDWGYRRLVLHYARLAAAAGGVDAFLIGSELRGLTTLRDGAHAFPFVEALCDLAAAVRGMLGDGTKVTYAADWTEYFGHHPADGSGDVRFHLDRLWAHPAIDAVGIDYYMPLADWRDEDYLGGNPDGFAGPYDPAGLRSAMTAGEGFDWYYASPEAREARLRSEIGDGAYGKPWVFRYKDLAGWWSNLHYDRVAGTEAGSPTAWVPKSKPIWLTEVGCPAVDKGPNQPNVFPDPKSAENALPHFSSGGRSDIAQRRYVEAHLDHWDPASPVFASGDNPVSPVYGGRMVDPARVYVWAWDARPFPAFPRQAGLWRDGGNWNLGHWLNGRLGGVAVGDLVNAVLADHGLPAADVAGADGTMHGYVIEGPCSARDAIEPVLDLYGIAAKEDAGRFVFAREGTQEAVAVADMAAAGARPAVELVRTPDQDLPAEAVLGFRDPFADYQTASVRHLRLGAGGARQHRIGFPGVLEREDADLLLADWMQRRWRERERVVFAVPPAQAAIDPGSVLTLPGSAGGMRFVVDEIEEGLVRTISARQIAGTAPGRRRPPDWDGPAAPPPLFGKPQAILLDLPMLADGDARDQFRAALWASPWRSQALYASPEDTGFALRSVAATPAFLGTLAAPVGPGFCGRIDRVGRITVAMHSGELASVSRLQLLNGANVAAMRSAAGIWEVLQFETAEEIAPSVWELRGLLRGQLGTDDAMLAGAADGADFVLLDQAVRPAGLLAAEVGLPLNWRAGPTGEDFSGETFAQQRVAGGLRALTPLSPVHLKARRQAEGGLAVSWIRRGRVDADGWEGEDIPLGEEGEAYRVEVATDTGTRKRSVTVGSPSWIYPSAALSADFPSRPATAVVTVRQTSAAAGPGIAARLAIGLA